MLRRGAIYALFLLLSCVSKNGPEWVYSETLTGYSCYNSAKLLFPACNTFNGLDVEIVRTSLEVRMYLDVHSLEIPVDPEDPPQVNVVVKIGNTTTNIMGELLLGGQRVFIPPWEAGRIIGALIEGEDVSLCVAQYKSNIPSCGFSERYSKLMQAF